MIPELKRFPDISLEDIDKLIENRVAEGFYIEYKSEIPDNRKIGKSITSFANTKGGYLIFGVDSDKPTNEPKVKTPVNKEDYDANRINDICNYIDKPVYVEKIFIRVNNSNKGIVIIKIPPSYNIPHFYRGKIYVREGESSKPIPLDRYDLINELFEKRKKIEKSTELYIENKIRLYSDNILIYNEQLPYANRECFLILSAYPFPLRAGLVTDLFERVSESKYRLGKIEGIARHNEDCLSYTTRNWLEDKEGIPIVPLHEFSISGNGSIFEIRHIETNIESFKRGRKEGSKHGCAGIPAWRVTNIINGFFTKSKAFYETINYESILMYRLFITGVKLKSLLPFDAGDEIDNQYADGANLFARQDSYKISGDPYRVKASDLADTEILTSLSGEFLIHLGRCFNINIAYTPV